MKKNVAEIAWLAVAIGLLGLSSCSQSPAAPAAKETVEVLKPNEKRDTWDGAFVQGTRVGYSHTTAQDVGSGRVVLRTENVNHLAIRRGGETSLLDVRIVTLERPNGELLKFEAEVSMGPTPIRTTGRVGGYRLEITTTGAAAAPVHTSIPWSADDRGPFAMEQSLLRKPMQPGERRTIKMFEVEVQQVADVEMTAKDYEPTKLRTGSQSLLRIETVTKVANNQKLELTAWTDRTGNILKSRLPMLGGLETYRVGKAEALEHADAAALDLLPSMMVKVEPPLVNAHRTKKVRYRLHLDGRDPASVFAAGATQAVKSIDANTAEITVYAIRPGRSDGNRNAPPDPPTADDLRPNIWVQSDDPLIVADAKKAAGDEKDPWRVAVALERFVNREVTKKDFSQTFASATEVARSHEGDCTEHSVFLMALCRARGIPARAAFGLVYLPSRQAFFYHMWTEVYIEKRWIPIDATLAQGGIGAGHLKIAQSNLTDATASSAFLPVAQILGRLSIKVVDAKWARPPSPAVRR
jgi:transglutaminase-like putative cysteine protease